jgi:hypothetical protein
MNNTTKTMMAVAAFALAIGGAKAGDFQIMRDPSHPTNTSAFVVKDSNTGAVIASWYQPAFDVWSFHDPYNKISVHVNGNGPVIDWTLN